MQSGKKWPQYRLHCTLHHVRHVLARRSSFDVTTRATHTEYVYDFFYVQ